MLPLVKEMMDFKPRNLEFMCSAFIPDLCPFCPLCSFCPLCPLCPRIQSGTRKKQRRTWTTRTLTLPPNIMSLNYELPGYQRKKKLRIFTFLYLYMSNMFIAFAKVLNYNTSNLLKINYLKK